PIFDNSFIFDSYSCRMNKGTHRAINRLNYFARKANKNNAKTIYILKLDIKKFFDSIDHNILLFLIKKKIKDKNVIWLIETIINSFSTEPSKGIPLGNITSQLFANIYLNELDYYIKHNLRIKYYIRYCDDFVIIDDNEENLECLILKISEFLNNNLKLSLHPDKIIIKKYHQGIDFLGYVSFPRHKILRTKTKRRMFKRIKQRINSESFEQTFQSYLGVLKHCNGHKIKEEIINILRIKLYER
ncbi:MAG: reverse transcriptase/maturase family protein, partial [bacterium]|nr:reverse transcriptase/maturase family protein [bacterium]